MSKLVYLAGSVSGLTYEGANNWREWVRKRPAIWGNGIECISPMRGNDHLLEVIKLEDAYEDNVRTSQRAIMDRCEFDVHRADVVLVNLLEAQRPSFGTVMEVAWAYHARKPVILAMDANNIHEHAMIRQAATYRVMSLDEAVELTAMTLGYQ